MDILEERYKQAIEFVDGRTPAERVERLVLLRRLLRRLAVGQAAYITLRTTWHWIPIMLGEPRLTQSTNWIAAAGFVCLFLYRISFGHGHGPEFEHDKWLMAYFIGVYLLAAQCALNFYSYHVFWPKDRLYHELLAAHAGPYAAAVRSASQAFGIALDVCGLLVLGLSAYLTKDFIMQRRQQRKEVAKAAEDAAVEKEEGKNGKSSDGKKGHVAKKSD